MKRLILCCDGTWNRADQVRDGKPCPTNVVRIAYRFAKRDGAIPQILFYDQGVGTGNVLDRFSGGAFGSGLEANIHDAYRFLIGNYELGDEIFMFGFSRGAFTVRSVAGMIRKCGILRRECVLKYLDAIALYRSENFPNADISKQFRRDFSVCRGAGIPIQCIGVWDTVGSLGIPLRGLRGLTRKRYQFHDTDLSQWVRHAYHALAIDERRAPFEPTLWRYKPMEGQKIEQVWFCGVHSDIGGGFPETGLSDITLEWMVNKARDAGLALESEATSGRVGKPDPLGMLHDSKKGLYRVTPGIDRSIGWSLAAPRAAETARVPDPTQSLHPSVLIRWDGDPNYRPTNVRDYFKRIGDSRGALP